MQTLSKKDFSIKELLTFMNKLNSKNKASNNNISINININNSEVASPGGDSPRFQVNTTESVINLSNPPVYSQLTDLSQLRESNCTSRSSSSNDTNKTFKLIMKSLKTKLLKNGMVMLSELFCRADLQRSQTAFWKIRQNVNFKLSVHARIVGHVSKKTYIPRFMKLISQ